MFILLVHNHYKSTHFGGEDLVFHQELALLRERLGADHVMTYELHNDRVTLPSVVFNLFFPFIHAFRIRKIVMSKKIDIVHVHNDFPLLSLWFMRFLRKTKCVRIQTLHNYRHWCISGILYRPRKGICEDCQTRKNRLIGVWNGCYRNSRLQSLIVYLAQGLFRMFSLTDDVDRFFCLSDHQRKKLVSFGVKENRICLKSNPIKLPKPNKRPPKEIDFLFVGRIEESKGIFKVLDSVDSSMQARIQIVGHSEEIEKLKKKYPLVIFHGKKSNSEVLSFMLKSRFLLQPSLCYETFGLTMVEAMSLGVPVVGFPIGTRVEFIQNGKNGFLINSSSIQEDLNRALSFSDYDSLCAAAISTAARYEENSIMEKQIAIYKELIEQRRGTDS